MSPTIANAVFWIAAATCLIAQIAVVRSAIRSPMPGAPDTTVVMPRRWKEIVWTIVPAIALTLILLATWRAIHPPMDPLHNMPTGHRMIEE